MLVEMLAENEDTFEILIAQKVCTLPMLESLERVGRHQLDPALLTNTSPAAQRAITQCLPPKEQKQVLTGYVPLVVRDNGGFKVEQVRGDEMNAHQASQAIRRGRILPESEQIEVIKEQLASKAARSLRYELRGDRIVFHEESSFTWAELVELAEKIKPKATDIESSIKRNQIK